MRLAGDASVRLHRWVFHLLALSAGVPTLHTSGATWIIERIDAPRRFDALAERALVLDAEGSPRIAYGGDHLYLASRDAAWESSTADTSPGVGAYAACDLDNLGNLHVVYVDEWSPALKYAVHNGSTWQTETIVSGSIGAHPSIAVAADGALHVAYVDKATYEISYAVHNGSAWSMETIDPAAFVYYGASLALDSSGSPHVAYCNILGAHDARYAYRDSGGWHVEIVPSSPAVSDRASLDVDADGRVYIAYCESFPGYTLKFACRDGDGWHPAETIVDGVCEASVVVESTGEPNLVWIDRLTGRLDHARNSGGAWAVATVHPGGACCPSMAITPARPAAIAYLASGTLRYAVDAGGAWAGEIVDETGDVGRYASLAIGPEGDRHIGYYDSGSGALKYALYSGGAWLSEIVAGDNDVGQSASIALHGTFRSIAHFDATERDILLTTSDGDAWTTGLIADDAAWLSDVALAADGAGNLHAVYAAESGIAYAIHDATGWHVEPVDSCGSDVGLAVDRAGRIHAAYSRCLGYKQFQLRYALRDTGGWTTETVAAASGQLSSSITVDSTDTPHLAYYDWYVTEFHYAVLQPSGWADNVAAGFAADDPSLRIDDSGCAHVAFHDGYAESLGYAAFGPAGWQSETVDDSADVGWYPSLALDPHGAPHIAYYDATAGDLKCARMSVPVLDAVPGRIELVAVEGTVPRPRTILVRNVGDAELTFSLACSAGWIACDPDGGCSTGDPCPVNVAFAPDGLQPGIEHSTKIVCTAPGAFGSPVTVEIVLRLLADSDGDGMPDGWEDDNGLNSSDPDDGDDDPDIDGQTNHSEFLARTDPRDHASCLRITRITPHGDGAVLHWEGAPPFRLWRRNQPGDPWSLIASGYAGASFTSETSTVNCWFRVEADEP